MNRRLLTIAALSAGLLAGCGAARPSKYYQLTIPGDVTAVAEGNPYPVTLLLGPQTALTVFMTAGFAGSALAMFAVLRRWDAGVAAAAIGGAVYGFSPAVLHSAIGHYDLQFAVLPPLIIDVGLRLALGRVSAVRGGLWLGLLVTAQLFITEETLLGTAIEPPIFVQ